MPDFDPRLIADIRGFAGAAVPNAVSQPAPSVQPVTEAARVIIQDIIDVRSNTTVLKSRQPREQFGGEPPPAIFTGLGGGGTTV